MSRSSTEKLSVLEGLLARVQKNALGARARDHVALARPATPEAPQTDELEVVDEAMELDDADELPTSSETRAHEAAAPVVLAKVSLVQSAVPAPAAPAVEDNELIEELAEEDEVAAAAELEPVGDDEPAAEAPVAPEPVAVAPEAIAAAPPPPEPVAAPPRSEPRRSDSIELAVQAAAAAHPIAIGDSLEADVPQRADAPPDRPSDAQLGALIELEEGPAAAIELAPSAPAAPAPPPHEEEEVLPAAQSPGQFARGLVPSTPPAPPPAEVSLVVPPSPPAAPVPEAHAAPAAIAVSVEAAAVGRATLSGEVAVFVAASKKPAPATFGELLDDALSL